MVQLKVTCLSLQYGIYFLFLRLMDAIYLLLLIFEKINIFSSALVRKITLWREFKLKPSNIFKSTNPLMGNKPWCEWQYFILFIHLLILTF